MLKRDLARHLLFAACLTVLVLPKAAAEDRFEAVFVNGLSEEIHEITLTLATGGEPRRSSSRVAMRPESEYRIGVQGAREPLRIVFDLATKSYDFSDLSGIKLDERLNFDIVHADGAPRLRQHKDGGVIGEAVGTERDYLNVYNLPNAVDKDDVVGAKTLDEVRELVAGKVKEAIEELGPPAGFDVEAGPIWNNEHAQERCPEAVAEWNEANGGGARWSGHWTTTVPGEMSVCNCVRGAADMAGTLFTEKIGRDELLIFPADWDDTPCVGRVGTAGASAEDGIAMSFRFKMPDADFGEKLDDILSDVRIDGFRPWMFRLEGAEDAETRFADGEDDKWDAQDKFVAAVAEARAASALRQSISLWVDEETYKKAAAGDEDAGAAPGVVVFVTPGVLEVIYMPNCFGMLQ